MYADRTAQLAGLAVLRNSCTMTNLVYGICTVSAFYVFLRVQPKGIRMSGTNPYTEVSHGTAGLYRLAVRNLQ